MQTGFQEFLRAVKDLCFPPVCPGCGAGVRREGDFIFCAACAEKIELIEAPFCETCGTKFRWSAAGNHLCAACLKKKRPYSRARSLAVYRGPVAKALQDFKYGGKTSVLPSFYVMKKRLVHLRELDDLDLILPVALHARRLRERGFNQALLLARIMFPEDKDKIKAGILIRHKWTIPQTGLNAKARRQNIKGSFSVRNPEVLAGKRVLIIDDVFTTGSTVDECALVVKRAGAGEVRVLTVARTTED